MAVPLPRWTRSVRRRPAAFVAILLLSAGAAVTCAATPGLIQAVDGATVRDAAASAAFPEDGFSVQATSSANVQEPGPADAVRSAITRLAGTGDFWSRPEVVDEAQDVFRFVAPGLAPVVARASYAPVDCDGMRITGRCPTDTLEALVPTAIARRTGWHAGTRVLLKEVDDSTGALYTLAPMRIVGTYDETAGIGSALADPTRLVQQASARTTPNLVFGTGEQAELGSFIQTTAAIRLDRPIGEADLPALRAAVGVGQRAGLAPDLTEASGEVTTRLDSLLASIDQQQTAAAVLAEPVGLAAILLAWAGLGAIAHRTARARAVEWGVGRMRGARRRARLAAVFAEPLVAVVAGAVLGGLLAPAVVRAGSVRLLGPDAVTAPAPSVAIAGAALAVLGSAVALVLASLHGALAPLDGLLQQRSEARRLSRPALALQVALVAVALAVLWSALTTPVLDGQQLALLLPGVLALAVALLAVRVAVLAVRITSTRSPRTLTGLVVGRGLVRAPSALVAAQLVLVSAAVAAFALQLGSASSTAQTARAQLATGAAQVLTVRTPPGASLIGLVDRADPGGRAAMAAEQVTSSGTTGLLALDTSRVSAVSSWRPAWRGGVDLARLRGTDAAPALTGTSVAVRVGDASQGGTVPSSTSAVDLQLIVSAPGGWTAVDLGRVRDGVLRAALPCSSGCRLVALTLQNRVESPTPWRARFTVTAVATDRQAAGIVASWIRSARWRPTAAAPSGSGGTAAIDASSAASGLTVSAVDPSGAATARLEPAVGPAVLPAVVTSGTALSPVPGLYPAVLAPSLTGAPIPVEAVARVTAVPRLLRSGVVVDLAAITRREDPAMSGAVQQVWLAPGDQRAVIARLRTGGVTITGVERAADAVATGLDSAANRAVLVGGLTALIGVVFGLLALAGARTVDMGERRRDWRTLRLAGSPVSALRRLALVQTAAPAMLGVLVGVGTGLAAAAILVRRLPLLAGETAGPPLDTGPAVGPLTALAGALLAAVAIVALALAAVEVRRARRGAV